VPPGGAPPPGRRCGPFPAALDALADWLLACGVPPVALASTGLSGRPWFERREARGGPVLRSDPRQATRVPGRPTTERLDGQWRHRLHTEGLLAGACRPTDPGCVLRGSVRHRPMRLPSAAQQMPPRQHALPQMPLQLTQGVRDLTGGTGLALLRALLAGARTPQRLAQWRPPPCPPETDARAKALQGHGRAAPLVA
jgi:transposase